MSQIRSVNTRPELIIMKELRRMKIYFAKHCRGLPGKPDIVFRRKKLAVFLDSDFWHMHPKNCVMPKTNEKYWKTKLYGNRERDKLVNIALRKQGWRVLRIW